MDIAAKYRTKYPPKEHEEAVRMLLEGITNKRSQKNEHFEDAARKGRQETRNKCDQTNYDGNSLSSENSSSVQDVTSTVHLNNNNNNSIHSKATSTGDSVSIDDPIAAYKEPIRSRTIAVQCDLKSSSLNRDNLFDASMQASSISSTRYGFYSFSPETLENRRKAKQESNPTRDIVSNNKNRITAELKNSHIEAPTSISELSSSPALSDNDAENSRENIGTKKPIRQQRNFSSAHDSSSTESAPRILPSQSNLRKQTLNSNRNNDNKYMNWDQENSLTARARINSLPRRPKTALSYVPTNKLMSQNRSSGLDSDSELIERPIKNRAISQQALTSSNCGSKLYIAGAPNDDQLTDTQPSCSNSDSELGESSLQNTFRFTDKGSINNSINQDFQGDRTEEMLIMKNGYSMQVKAAKPRLVLSSHNEQVRDYKTLERNLSTRQAVQQKQLHTNNINNNNSINNNNNSANGHYDDDLDNNARERDFRLKQQGQQEFGKKRLMRTKSRGDLERCLEENYNFKSSCDNNQLRKPLSSKTEQCPPLMNHEQQRYNEDGHILDNRLNSMSLSRRYPKQQYANDRFGGSSGNQVSQAMINGYLTSSRRPKTKTLSRDDGAHSQMSLTKASLYLPKVDTTTTKSVRQQLARDPMKEVSRSTSMRQINNNQLYYKDVYDQSGTNNGFTSNANKQSDFVRAYLTDELPVSEDRLDSRRFLRNESDDSESPSTRTWANPNSRPTLKADGSKINPSPNQKSSRSYSLRDVNNVNEFDRSVMNAEHSYNGVRNSESSPYSSNSESSALEMGSRFVGTHQLDYDSQHRLNESGLPEINSSTAAINRPRELPSYNALRGNTNMQSLYTNGRSSQIRGRAMSQQSLTRPAMPLTSGRRRGGSNSGSDVGGSSMSLVSRLHGRYENAHTRSPVVMYIPPTLPKSSSLLGESSIGIGKSGTIRKSLRNRQKSSSQDRSRKSLSRNGSDSETSSLFKTLIKPRNRHANYSSKRIGRGYNGMFDDDDEENKDGVGQLASELDTYKFRRRYSVPKDAKINWFAKLKQRVSSSSK